MSARWRAMYVTVAAKRECLLGEGPLWDARAGRLYWVDIRRSHLHWLAPATEESGEVQCSAQVSALGLRARGGLIAAADRAVGVLDAASGRFEARVTFEPERPRNRTNDGGVGGDGRFWFGTMDDGGEQGRGALYALDAAWSLTRVRDGMSIPNGIVTTEDGATLYMADSGAQEIRAYALDPASGTLGSDRMFASMAHEVWTPDGAALDEEGCLWSAQWDGWRVIRFWPDGSVDRIVEMPVSRPTCCAFGGPELDTLYITSARDGLDAAALAKEPLAGSVFALRVGVRGAAYPAFAG